MTGGSGKARSGAWIDVIEAGDDGWLRCEAYEEHWTFDAITRISTPHGARLPVEWRETALAVRVRDGHFSLRLPPR